MLGTKLKEHRLRKGLTQLEVSELIRCTDVQVGRIEKGVRTPTFEQLQQLFEIYKTSKEDQLELLQIFFETKLPDQLNACKDAIHDLSADLITDNQLDDYISNLPNNLGPIIKDPMIVNLLSLLKLVSIDKRKKTIGDIASVLQLDDDKFEYNMDIRCILLKLPYDNLRKIKEMIDLIS